ncbi:MAG: phosphoenolpyruvate--protein phosphotransferase [Alphaproteobacteria bacterium]|nr:phosphoenolpyruvate--protein phosphotransferase [Alphaproteobacteria bacterium]
MVSLVLLAPLEGWVSPLEEVPDPVFSDKVMGDGLAIDPTNTTVFAPCDGIVATLAKHAVMIRAACGAEILIHVGLETVALAGRGFRQRVGEGQAVKAGDPLLDFDLEFLAAHAKSLISPVIVANGEAFAITRRRGDCEAKVGDVLMELESVAPAGKSSGDASQPASRQVVIAATHGLHARPAALVAASAKPFQAEIMVTAGARQANAKSAMALMTLGTKHGDTLTIAARGADAAQAADAVALAIARLPDEPVIVPVARTVASPQSRSQTIIHGIGAAPGIAVGHIFHLRAADVAVAAEGKGLAHEAAELRRAVSAVKERLQKAAAAGDPAHRGIATAHIALLEDAELQQVALRAIEMGSSAAFAWRQAVRGYVDILRAADDELLRERASDLLDLERQMLGVLTGEGPRPIPPPSAVLVADEIFPSDLLGFQSSRPAGIATSRGGATSHAAILAAGMGIPALVGAGTDLLRAEDGALVVLNADEGWLDLNPGEEARRAAEDSVARAAKRRVEALAMAGQECHTADGVRIEVFANLGKGGAREAVQLGAEGCGLLRTEFLFMDRTAPPDEDEQYTLYKAAAEALGGRELVLRTFDIGADKPAPYLAFPPEENPALGIRGVRTALMRPELLRTQLRAAARVGCKIMLPMIASVDEVVSVRAILDEACRELGVTPPPLGIMIETPASALLADRLARVADFFSIGTNDLTQYTLAMDRGHRDLAARLDALHPAVLRLIAQTVQMATGKPVGVCGGLAAEMPAVPVLLGLGIGRLSVPAGAIPNLKSAIRTLALEDCRAVAEQALTLDSAQTVRAMVRQRFSWC